MIYLGSESSSLPPQIFFSVILWITFPPAVFYLISLVVWSPSHQGLWIVLRAPFSKLFIQNILGRPFLQVSFFSLFFVSYKPLYLSFFPVFRFIDTTGSIRWALGRRLCLCLHNDEFQPSLSGQVLFFPILSLYTPPSLFFFITPSTPWPFHRIVSSSMYWSILIHFSRLLLVFSFPYSVLTILSS